MRKALVNRLGFIFIAPLTQITIELHPQILKCLIFQKKTPPPNYRLKIIFKSQTLYKYVWYFKKERNKYRISIKLFVREVMSQFMWMWNCLKILENNSVKIIEKKVIQLKDKISRQKYFSIMKKVKFFSSFDLI